MKLQFLLCISLLAFVISQQKACNQQKEAKVYTHESIKIGTDSIFSKLVEIRRDFHENPELAGNEIHTQQKIINYLVDLGIEVETNMYGHSVVGILKGEKGGKKIAWRSEMDALPNDLPDMVDFKSKIKGIQHGCGHDIHMAIALGIAEILAKNKKYLKGTVYFIFQPEEETFAGAKGMLDNGLLSKIHPDEIYGLHVTALPVGQIVVKPNEMFAYQRRVQIKLKDKLTKEQTKELTKKIHDRLSRTKTGSKPWEIQNISNTDTGLTNPNTIFQDYLIIDENFKRYSKQHDIFLEAYLYETNSSHLKDIIPTIKQVIEADSFKDQLLSVSFVQENPTVFNDPKLTNTAVETLNTIYGKGFVAADYGTMPFFNDDFAYLQQKIPGVYFFLGGSNIKKDFIAMNHAPNFRVDEECIKTGVKSFSSLIFERLNEN